MDIFKEYDIRGIYPSEIDEDEAVLIGRGIGKLAKKIYVDNDTRKGSKAINGPFIDGLLKEGADVFDMGLGPVTLAAFASFREKTYGVSVTASHNPAKYTGILLYRNGLSVSPKLVKKAMLKGGLENRKGRYERIDYSGEYLNILKKVGDLSNINIGVDPMGGAGTKIVEEALRMLNAKPFMLHSRFTENFYGKVPEPSRGNSAELMNFVRKNHLDFGVQLDGDADRAVFVDDDGNFIDPMETALVFIKYLKIKSVIAAVSCSQKIEKYAKVEYVPVGRPFIERALVKKRFDFGVESSAHYYFNRYYPFSDGILAALLMGKILHDTKKRLREILSGLPKIYMNSFSLNFEDENEREKVIRKIEDEIISKGKISKIDGVKVFLSEGYILVRKSNTEPLIRIMYEGKDKASFERIERMAEGLKIYGGELAG